MNEQSLEELIATGKVKSALLFKGGMSERDRQIVEWFQAEQDALQARLEAAEAELKAEAKAKWEARKGRQEAENKLALAEAVIGAARRLRDEPLKAGEPEDQGWVELLEALAVFDGLARSGTPE